MYGFSVESAKAEPCDRGARVKIEFTPVTEDEDQDPARPRAPLELLIESKHGQIVGPLFEVPPDLSPEAVAQLRDRLASTFVAQIFMGLVHGDPHMGNFVIMADGITVALFDYGLTLSLGWRHFSAPLSLLTGALLGKPRMIAKALVDMSAANETMTSSARAAAIDRTEQSLRPFFRDISQKSTDLYSGRIERQFKVTLKRLEVAVDRAWNSDGLTPAPTYLLLVKAILAMAGNFEVIDRRPDVPTGRLLTGARVLRQLHIQRLPVPKPLLRYIKKKKVERLNAAARAVEVDDAEARLGGGSAASPPARASSLPG
jgi:predicted unusual protein kinase regulating ubiquinone biosynthesis (AarF/ABC1/UbiB family)